MTRFTLGTFLATVAMFVWGAIFWMNPLPYSVLGKSADDAAVGKVLLEHFPANATYIIPGMYNAPDQLAALHRAGPIATVHMRREGAEAMSPSVLGLGFLQELVVVMLLGGLLNRVRASLPTYLARVRFVTLAGIAAAVFGSLGMPIWWYHPWPFHLVSAVYAVTAWFVAGLVLAAFIRPKPPVPAAQP